MFRDFKFQGKMAKDSFFWYLLSLHYFVPVNSSSTTEILGKGWEEWEIEKYKGEREREEYMGRGGGWGGGSAKRERKQGEQSVGGFVWHYPEFRKATHRKRISLSSPALIFPPRPSPTTPHLLIKSLQYPSSDWFDY